MMAVGRSPQAEAFLLGAPRSGTSLLYRALCLHREAAWISNWVARHPGVPELAALNVVPRSLPRARHEVWFSGGDNAYVYGHRRAWWRRALPQPVEGERLFHHLGLEAEPAGQARVDDDHVAQLRAVLSRVRRFSGGTVLINKRITNNRRVGLFAAAFPRARFVEVRRDGRAVAASLGRVDWWPDTPLWWWDGTPRQWAREGGDPLELCARHWVAEVQELERGLARVPASRRLCVHYEELLDAPVDVIRHVAAFVGLGPDAAFDTALRNLSFPDRNAGWVTAFSRDDIRRVENIQGATLRQFGYAMHTSAGAP